MKHGNQCVEVTEWSRMGDINRFVNSLLLHKAYPRATHRAYNNSSDSISTIEEQEKEGLR